MKTLFALLMAVALVFTIAPISMAGDKDSKDTETKVSDESERMMNATTTLEEVIGIPEDGIPQTMFDNAAAT